MTQKQKNSVNQKIRLLFFITPIIMILTMLFTHLIFNFPLFSDNDSTNWVTSVIETGIGTSITIAILIYSNNQLKRSEEQQDKIAELVLNIQNIEQRHDRREKKRLTVFSYRILSNLETILKNYYVIRQELANYLNNGNEESKQNILLLTRKDLEVTNYFTIPNIKNDIGDIAELFEDPLLAKNILHQCIHYETTLKEIQDNFDWENNSLIKKISAIDNQIELLNTSVDEVKKEITGKI
jgi:hypothetical protein